MRPLVASDIEKVRVWRNSDHVRTQMIFREIISESQQIDWFRRAQLRGEEHFIYSFRGHDVGLLSLKPASSGTSFEGGIFCGEKSFLGDPLNLHAVLWLYDLAFGKREMKIATIQVLASNSTAMRLNQFIGFREISRDSRGVVTFQLDREQYVLQRAKNFPGAR